MRDKLWYWGSYGTQDIKVGVVNFYENTPQCRPAGVPVGDIAKILPTDVLRDCLATDLTTLNNYNWKLTWAPIRNNKFNFQNTWAEKVRNARDASDTRPLETAYRQKAVTSEFGPSGWDTGPSPIWKASDQHVINDRWLVDLQYAHIGNNFTLTFQDPEQRDIQPRFDITSGIWGRSFNESIFVRPTQSIDVTTSYFLPNTVGGDHALKFGYRWRTARGESISHTGGNAVARYSNSTTTCATFAAGCDSDLFRDGATNYNLKTHAAYVQDTYTVNRFTFNVGFRWDRQTDEALASSVAANPIIPNIMPAIDFPGIDGGVTWDNFSPRVGVNYDITGNGKSVARASYAAYYGQMGPGQIAGNRIAVAQVSIRYPWADLNGDTFVQSNELNTTSFITKSTQFDPTNPTSYLSPGTVDPNVKNDRTREFLVGLQQEVMRNVALEINYVWRKYDNFVWSDRLNWTSANYRENSLTPTNCSAVATCDTVIYFTPTSPVPSPFVYTNVPDRFRDYNGVELALNKRLSNRWMANVSFAYNSAIDHWDSANAYEDPTNIANLTNAAYAPESAGSGVGNVFTNAEWLFKASGLYTLPWWDINVAGGMGYNQGYPFPQEIAITSRPNSGGSTAVYLAPLGDVRYDNVFMMDFKVDKAFTFGAVRFIPSMDVFNLTNTNTVIAQRRTQYSYNATSGVGSSSSTLPPNQISGIPAPRVIRFGLRVTW
jgi:hypothetical protein